MRIAVTRNSGYRGDSVVFVLIRHQPIVRKRDELFRFAMQVEYIFWSTIIATLIQLGIALTFN